MQRLALSVVIGLATLLSACSIEDGGGETAAATTSSTSSTSAPDGDDVTSDSSPTSAAFVEVGGVAYDLDAECHAAGVGEIVLTALTPGLVEPRVELYVQAFLAEPYIGIAVTTDGEQLLYEPSLAAPFEIAQQGEVFRVDDVALVTDLDLATGTATDAGTGTVVVECAGYSEGLPPGFGSG